MLINSNIAYCTIVAENYLPQAMSLFSSVNKHHPEREFYILLIGDTPKSIGINPPNHLHIYKFEDLPLSDFEKSNLAAIYDVVELSTGLKPLFLSELLREFQNVVYLDPDMFVVEPLSELDLLLETEAIVLTPHLLKPITPGTPYLSEINTLTVGIHNLGFCAVNRNSQEFLDWWWSHLQRECLIYPLLGLFVDQKWVDIGSVFFNAYSFKHFGYNIGHWNLHERRFNKTQSGYQIVGSNENVKLMHFSGFDPLNPKAISSRQNESLQGRGLDFEALDELSVEYADIMLDFRKSLGVNLEYKFARDSSGKILSRRLRRTYRSSLLSNPETALPSPFDINQAKEFSKWRKRSWKARITNELGDIAIAINYAMPGLAKWVRTAFPSRTAKTRATLLAKSNIRR